MKDSQLHYADMERGNESNPNDEWSKTACGLELEPKHLTYRMDWVSCKNCLKVINRNSQNKLVIKE